MVIEEQAKLTVTATVRIQKYEEGQCPEGSDPFETIEKEIVLEGAEAAQLIKEMGGDINGIN